MKRTSSIKGFTLIELMVVIVILGILAAVIAPRVPGFVNKAKEGKTKGNLGGLRSALNIYYSDNDGRYPSDATAYAAATAFTLLTDALTPKYLKKIPEVELPGGHPTASGLAYPNGNSATMQVGDNSGWRYGNWEAQTATWGNVLVDCNAHKDNSNATTGNAWSGF